jgi:DNA-binding transcriptional LysR family regulator
VAIRSGSFGVELRYLHYALAVATHRSYRRAAVALRIRRSTLDRRIRDVEDAIGYSLFENAADGTRLTEAGKIFISRSRRTAYVYGNLLRAGSSRGLESRLRRDIR